MLVVFWKKHPKNRSFWLKTQVVCTFFENKLRFEPKSGKKKQNFGKNDRLVRFWAKRLLKKGKNYQ